MDGRLQRLLAGTVLCGLIGCSQFRDKSPKLPMSTGEPPLAMTDKPIVEDRRGKKDGPIKVETLIAVANVRVQAAADTNRSSQEREELANNARVIYQKALAREPKNLDALRGMARMYAVVRDKDLCVEWYQRAAKAHPNNAEIWYEMGKTLGSHFKDKDAAVACLHTAANMAPDNRAYRTELGFTLGWAGRYDESYAWLIRTMPEAKARYNLAGIAEHNGQTEQAKMQLAMALKAEPNHEPSKQMMAALSGVRDEPAESVIQNASHKQWATPAPMDSVQPMPPLPKATVPQTRLPDPMPLTPTSGWDR